MTRWRNRASEEHKGSRAARDLSMNPSDADIQALLDRDWSEADVAELVFACLEAESSPAERKRIEDLLPVAGHPWPAMPLDPKDFVEFVAAELGTDAAKVLVGHAFEIAFQTGEPERWIVEVWHARQRGDISRAVAHFLITRFAVSTVLQVAVTDPVFSNLTAQKHRIER